MIINEINGHTTIFSSFIYMIYVSLALASICVIGVRFVLSMKLVTNSDSLL